MLFPYIITALYAYCLGCFCTGYYLVKWLSHQDLHELGSGTLGARNVARILGFRWAIPTLLIDMAKGTFAVGITEYFYNSLPQLTALAFICVILGHLYPMQLKYKGGKGIATFAGGLVVLNIYGLIIALIIAIILHCLKFKKATISAALALISIISSVIFVTDTILQTTIICLAFLVLICNLKKV